MGLGFDVLSFDETDDSERFLEVETTGLGKYFPFYATINEINCSADVPGKYQLYRVFDFSRDPRLFILHGSLTRTVPPGPDSVQSVDCLSRARLSGVRFKMDKMETRSRSNFAKKSFH